MDNRCNQHLKRKPAWAINMHFNYDDKNDDDNHNDNKATAAYVVLVMIMKKMIIILIRMTPYDNLTP